MELPATHLRLPAALPYPLTVQRIHAQPGAHVQKAQRLFTYSFLPNKPDDQGRRERQVREWDSPVLGQVVAWDVREGDIIREPRYVPHPGEQTGWSHSSPVRAHANQTTSTDRTAIAQTHRQSAGTVYT